MPVNAESRKNSQPVREGRINLHRREYESTQVNLCGLNIYVRPCHSWICQRICRYRQQPVCIYSGTAGDGSSPNRKGQGTTALQKKQAWATLPHSTRPSPPLPPRLLVCCPVVDNTTLCRTSQVRPVRTLASPLSRQVGPWPRLSRLHEAPRLLVTCKSNKGQVTRSDLALGVYASATRFGSEAGNIVAVGAVVVSRHATLSCLRGLS